MDTVVSGDLSLPRIALRSASGSRQPCRTSQGGREKDERAGFRHHCQLAEQAVHLVHQVGCEVNGIGITAGAVIPSDKSPEIADYNRIAGTVGQRTQQEIGVRVEDIDFPVAEISDQEIVGQGAKTRGRYVEPPRRIKNPAGRDALDEISIRVELVDEPITGLGNVVVLCGVLRRIADEQVAIAITVDVERRPAHRPRGTGGGGCGSVKLKPDAGLILLSKASVLPLLKLAA